MTDENKDGAAEIRQAGENAEHIIADDHTGQSPCPVTPLGRRQGIYYYLSPGGEVIAFTARDHSVLGITALFDGDLSWLYETFPRTGNKSNVVGWIDRDASAWLMRQCSRRGFFDAGRFLRGPGIWSDGKGGLILHCGDKILASGKWIPAGCRIDNIIYTANIPEPKPATDAEGNLKPATAGDAHKILESLNLWAWRNLPGAPRLVLGWLIAASICGALKWRPHIWITGDQGTGKSTLNDLMTGFLGEGAILRVSDPSEAGIRQALDSAARPVLIDEIEVKPGTTRAQRVIELSRLASTDNQGAVARGSSEGIAKSWHIRGCFYFTSIGTAPLAPQDKRRICVIDLEQLPLGDDPVRIAELVNEAKTFAAKTGPGLRARAIVGWKRLRLNQHTYDMALAGLGHSARQADQLGTLLACADTVLNDEPTSLDDAIALIETIDVTNYVAGDDDAQHYDLLDHLLTTPIRVDFLDGGNKVMTIGEVVEGYIKGEADSYEKQLKRHGLTVRTKLAGEAGGPWLVVSNRHRGLEAIFEGTSWAGKSWAQYLKRIPGARWPNLGLHFAGPSTKAVWVPITWLDKGEGDTE